MSFRHATRKDINFVIPKDFRSSKIFVYNIRNKKIQKKIYKNLIASYQQVFKYKTSSKNRTKWDSENLVSSRAIQPENLRIQKREQDTFQIFLNFDDFKEIVELLMGIKIDE